uniref:Peptidase C14 caspase domain-containing protein n=1 Tax=Kalanchoe fedtschenkoi TaxID=63787 RepID=A0A7N0VFP1_KALFE
MFPQRRFQKRNSSLFCRHCSRLLEAPAAGKLVRCAFCHSMISVPETGKISYPIQKTSFTKLKYKLSPDDGSRGYETLNAGDPFSSNVHHKKKAFLCGVTYRKQKYTLRGTVNDVKSMRALLTDKFNFPAEGILVLTEMETRPRYTPTKENMRRALNWLVSNMRPGDSLVFYYSGHGLRQLDFENDELDGFDETLCPVDFKTTGMILDNEINTTIVHPLPKGVRLHAFVDSCHSGTILDLPNVYDRQKGWIDNTPPSRANKNTKGGFAVSLSACADKQIAADTTAFTGKEMRGALTWSLVNALSQRPNPTYEELLEYTVEAIERANRSSNNCSEILKKVFRGKI